MEITEENKRRFWSHVEKAGDYQCWRWTGHIKPSGYGGLMINKKHDTAHRVSYRISLGDIPKDKVVMHICDHKWCVNPNHLRLGTQKENIHDRLWKHGWPKTTK